MSGRGSTHLSQVMMPHPPLMKFAADSHNGQDLQSVWYGINSTICQAKTRDQNANKLRKKVFGQRKTKRKKIY